MDTPPATFGANLLRLARRCRAVDKHVAASAGLTIDEIHCLSVLFSERPSSVRVLSEMISVSPTQASKILRHLEQKGFVSRTSDVSDHRKELVLLTDEGRKAVERVLSLYGEIGMSVLGSWPDESQSALSWLLRTASQTD